MRKILGFGPPLVGIVAGYRMVVRGALTLDLGIGRRVRPLGPIQMRVAATPETVFDVIAGPYLGKTPQTLRQELEVIERGTDMVLAAHFTEVGRGAMATTLETVRFERPHRISFRLVRGPVPHVLETFELRPEAGGTEFAYRGDLGTDLWRLGQWWGDRVAREWEGAVKRSLETVRDEAERRTSA